MCSVHDKTMRVGEAEYAALDSGLREWYVGDIQGVGTVSSVSGDEGSMRQDRSGRERVRVRVSEMT